MMKFTVGKAAAVLVAPVLLFSCQQRMEEPVDVVEHPFTLIASYGDQEDDTRTVISGGTSVFWEPQEEIKLFRSDGSSFLFTSANAEPAATATFSGTLTEGEVAEGEELWAVYPFSEEASFDGETLTALLPSQQVARAGSFARNMNLTVARTTSRQLLFYNVGGGVRFTVTQDGISKVIFEGLGGEIISGKVSIGFEDGLPVVKSVTGGSPFIALTPPDGGTFQKGEWYYIVAIPGALSQGFKLRFYRGDDYARRITETPVTLKRSLYGSLAQADASLEYESTTTSFPETEEEIEESIDMSESIASISQNIIDNIKEVSGSGEIDAEAVAEELEQIEGVESAIPTESGTSIVVKQTNGVYINVILQSFADDYDSSTRSLGPVSDMTSAYSKAESRIGETSSAGKKALILMPVYDEAMDCFRQYSIYDYGRGLYSHFKQYLQNCGYEVEECLNQKATLERFRGSNLQQYDFVLIHSHGGYNLMPVNGTGEYTGWMTASKVTDDTGKRFFSVTDFCDEAIGAYDGELHYWITSEAIKRDRPSFNDTFFYIFACHGAKKTDMYTYLFERGANAYCGHTDVANKLGSPVVADQMLYALSSGLSLEEAYDWTMNHSYKYDGSVPNWDLLHFDYLQKDYNGPVYLFDATPYNLQSHVSNNQVVFSWEQAPSSGEYRYSLVINDYPYYVGSDKEYMLYFDPGDYSWYVQTYLLMDDEVVATFNSNPKSFTVSQSTQGEPIISVYPTSITFEDTEIYKQTEQKFMIMNNGDADLEIMGFRFPQEPDDGFFWDDDPWDGIDVIPPGGVAMLALGFSPYEAKYYSGDLVISSNASNQPSLKVHLSGKGLPSTSHTIGHVDLGLSVLWASVNIGASKPEEIGDYYAWGEVHPKDRYDYSSYKWCLFDSGWFLTRYVCDAEYGYRGFVDNKTDYKHVNRYPYYSDDAAKYTWGGKWRTPSIEEYQELMTYCDYQWMSHNGILGMMFTSKKPGYTDQWIFLPMTSYKQGESLDYGSNVGLYWASGIDVDYPLNAKRLYFDRNSIYTVSTAPRYYGYNIRAVCDR